MIVAILIPALNEEPTIAEVVHAFRAACLEARIIVFDNASTDSTARRALEAGAEVRVEPRRGKGHVVQSMFRAVDADVYVMVDGDATYPAERIHDLIHPIVHGSADMVIGSRLHRGSASDFRTLNRLGNVFYATLLRRLFGVRVTDLLSGYRAFSRRLVTSLPLLGGGFETEAEMTIKAVHRGFRVAEVPVSLVSRPRGATPRFASVQDGLLILNAIVTLFRDYEPLTFFGLIALLLAATAAGVFAAGFAIAAAMLSQGSASPRRPGNPAHGDAPLSGAERLMNRELARGQLEQNGALRSLVGRGSRGDPAELTFVTRRGPLRAAQQSLHPREQFHEAERLGHVVVGADLEADDLPISARFLTNVDAGLLRQHHVEDDQVVIAARRQAQAVEPVRRHLHRMARTRSRRAARPTSRDRLPQSGCSSCEPSWFPLRRGRLRACRRTRRRSTALRRWRHGPRRRGSTRMFMAISRSHVSIRRSLVTICWPCFVSCCSIWRMSFEATAMDTFESRRTFHPEARNVRRLEDVVVYETAIREPRVVGTQAAELVVVTSGLLQVDFRAAPVRVGEILLSAPDEMRRLASASRKQTTATHFQLHGALTQRFHQPGSARIHRSDRFGDAVGRMMYEGRSVDVCSSLVLTAAICHVLAVARRLDLQSATDEPFTLEIARAKDYVAAHLSEPIPLPCLARVTGMSERGLRRRFALELNMSPLAYVRHAHITASRLLRETDLPIAEIAAICGFYDHGHLTRTFREYVGPTPAEYRRSSAGRSHSLPTTVKRSSR